MIVLLCVEILYVQEINTLPVIKEKAHLMVSASSGVKRKFKIKPYRNVGTGLREEHHVRSVAVITNKGIIAVP